MRDDQPEVLPIMGGCWHGREFDPADPFETAVERALGGAIRADESLAVEMWSAMANVAWKHPSENFARGYSFRAAGDLVVAIRRDGSHYMTWYCAGPDGVVSDRVASAMAAEGWTHTSWDA